MQIRKYLWVPSLLVIYLGPISLGSISLGSIFRSHLSGLYLFGSHLSDFLDFEHLIIRIILSIEIIMGDLRIYLYKSKMSFFSRFKPVFCLFRYLIQQGHQSNFFGTKRHSLKAKINQSQGSSFLHLGDTYQLMGYPKSYQRL